MSKISNPMIRRAGAVSILAAAVGGFVLFGVLPVVGLMSDYDRAIAEHEELLAQNLRVASRRAGLEAERDVLIASLSSGTRFLDGESADLIAANLQEQVKQLAGRFGATLNSTQTMASEDESGFRKVTLRVGMAADTGALQSILYSLETATPFLFVDNVELRSASLRAGREGAGTLQVRFDLYGFMRWSGGRL